MKRLILPFVITLLFCAVGAPAQTYDGLTIPTTHPRLMGYSNPTNLATARAWWATKYPTFTPGTCNNNNPHNCEMTAFAHLMTATNNTPVDCSSAISWAMTTASNGANGQGFPAGSAQNEIGSSIIIVYDFCHDQMATLGDTATFLTNFVKGWAGSNSSNGGTLGYVCPLASSGLGLDNNFCWGNNRNAFDWGVASYWDYTDSNANAQANLDQFFNTWTSFKTWAAIYGPGGGGGGVAEEGMAYGASNYSGGGPRDVLMAAKAMGRDFFTETNFYRDAEYALIYGTTPAPTYDTLNSPLSSVSAEIEGFPYDDGALSNDDMYSSGAGGLLMYQIDDVPDLAANEYAGTNLAGYTRTWLNTITSQIPITPYVAALDAGGAGPSGASSLSGLPLDYWAQGDEFLWTRKAWDTSSTVVKLELGDASEVSHVHPWAGNWQVWRGGRWLSRSTAGYSIGFTGYNSTSYIDSQFSGAMNEILVNPDNQGCTPWWPSGNTSGTCQGDGGEYRQQTLWSGGGNSNAINPLAAPQPQRIESQPGYTYASVDISGAYYSGGYQPSIGEEAQFENPAVQQVVREFVWVRDLETLVIFDRVQARALNGVAASAMRRTFLAHCEVNWNLVDANHATCVDGSQQLSLTTLLPATPSPAYHVTNEAFAGGSGENASGGNEQYRLEVNDLPGTAQSYFLHVAQAMPSSGGTKLSPTVSLSGSTYTVTLDANHSLTFVQGASSSGGSITINGTTSNFTSTVEPYAITNSGPVWGSGSTYSLTTSTSGTGSGTISGSNCPGSGLAAGTAYTCTATASSGSTFVSMTDGCGGTVSGNTTSGTVTSNCTVSAVFNLSGPTLTSIAVTPGTASIVAGSGTQQYAAQCTYSDSSTSNCTTAVSWSSSNAAVATMSSGGLASGVGAGSTTIKATSGSITGSGALSVTSPALTGITVTPATTSIVAGTGTEQYAAQCTYSNSTTSNCTSTVTWSSTNSAAATISTSGMASAVAAGSTTIKAVSGSITGSGSLTVSGSALSLGLGTCSSTMTGTQYVAFSGCTLAASGGASPYTYSWSSSSSYASLPEGLALNSATGALSGTVYGQGGYTTQFIVTDSQGTTATRTATFAIAGNNTLQGCQLFPTNSAFHINVASLPVDASPAAPIDSAYQSATLHVFFGASPVNNLPNGIPFLVVPSTQSSVTVNTANGSNSYFSSGPIPAYAPIESTSNAASTGADNHVLVVQTGSACQLYEMYQGVPPSVSGASGGAWNDNGNASWSDLSATGTGAFQMPPNDEGTTDAAGLPVTPLVVNADEVIGTGTPSAPNGTVQHPIRFTVSQALRYYVWPATATSGGSANSCSGSYTDPTGRQLLQSAPPSSCTAQTGPMGEIYRLKTSVANPACAASSPQASIIIQGLRNYGIILADNGTTGGLIGTPDSRWNDNDLACLTGLTLSDFEPVNVSSVIADTTPVTQGSTTYYVPATYRANSTAPTIVSISVTPATASIVAGTGTQQYAAQCTYSNSTTSNCTSTVTWSSSNNAAATIASGGLATGVAAGTATITATSGSITGTASLTVTSPSLTGIAVTPATSSIIAGTGTQQYAAQCTYSNSTTSNCTSTVTWSSSNNAAATIASGGLATGVAAGTATITATAGSITGSASLTVTSPSLTGIAVTPATSSIIAGTGTQQYEAQCTYSNSTTSNCTSTVTWSSTNSAAATISSNGLASAVAAGTTTIKALSGSVTGSGALTVTSASVTGITVTPATLSIVAGTGTEQYTAQCTYSNSTTSNCTGSVTWTSSTPAAATISAGGMASGIAAGNTSITAASGGITGTAVLTVTNPTLTGISVTPVTASIVAGTGTQQFAAQCNYSNSTNSDCTSTVTWSSTNSAAATISAGGLASAVAAGSTTIKATSGSVTGSGALTVTSASLTGITVTPSTASIVSGTGTEQYAAQCTYSNSTTSNCTGSVTWSSGSTATATIAAGGLASGVAAGTATITATSGSITGSATLTVTSPSLTGITVSPPTASLVAGTGTQQYSAQCTYSNSTTSNCTSTVTWSSTNPAAATVSSGGMASGVAAGTTTIKATSGSVTGSGVLTVTSPSLAGITVSPATASIVAGTGTEQYSAQCTYSNSTTSNCTSTVSWSSSNPATATIAGGGLASAVAAGSTTITATSGSVTGTGVLTVTSPSLTSITVTPGTASIVAGTGTEQYAAQCNYSNSTTSNCTSTVTWSSSSTATATVASGGLASGVAAGTSTIAATSGGITGSAVLTVTNATLTGITVSPATASIVAGSGTEQYSAQCTYSNSTTSNCTSTVTWSSSSPATATIAAGGLASGVAAGSTTIKATSGSVSGIGTLTVTSATLTSILVTPGTASIVAGTGTQQYAAQCTYSNSTTANCTSTVTWSSSSAATATIASGGLASGVSAGSATVTATSGSVTGTGVLTVTSPSLTGITVTPGTASIVAGTGTEQYAAQCTYSNSTTSNCTSTVTWSSSSPATATIAAGGLASGVAAGSATIKATSGSVIGTGVLTVTNASLTGITVAPGTASIVARTGTQQYSAQCTYSNSTTTNCTSNVTWSSSNPAAATIAANGLASGVAAGNATIVATSGAVTGSGVLTITNATLTGIIVTPSASSIVAGTGTQQYAAQCAYSNSTTSNCTSTVTWSSSNSSAATIAAEGLASGIAAGSTTIKATSGSITGNGVLTVTNATLTAITVTPATASIAAGTGTQQYGAQCAYSNSTTSDCTSTVTWSSSSSSAATIAAGGLASGVAAGTTTIAASSGSVTGTGVLTVTSAIITGIAVTPATATIVAGTGTAQYTAQCTYSNNTTNNCTSTVTWSDSNPAAATLANNAMARGVSAGTTTITATSGSFSASGILTVRVVGNPAGLEAGTWAWMGGSSTAPSAGVPYMAAGPDGRQGFANWKDGAGNLWLFGGEGLDSAGTNGLLSDLWEFAPSTQQWAFVSGHDTIPAADAGWSGVYGALGTPASGNAPGGRKSAASWTDQSGNLWLFGGAGYDSTGTNGSLNDLWKFVPSTQEWTWENGSSTVPGASNGQPGVYGDAGSPAANLTPGGRWGANTWTDSQGNLWLFGGMGYDAAGASGSLNDLWELNPATDQWAWMGGSTTVGSNGGQAGVYSSFGSPSATGAPSGRSQAVSWVDNSGNLWLFGGKGYDSTGTLGYLNDLWEFNTSTQEWAWMGGSNTVGCAGCGVAGSYGSVGLAASTNTPGGRSQAMGWTDSDGNLWLFGGSGVDSTGSNGILNDLWEFIPSTLEWAWMGGSSIVPAANQGEPGVYGQLAVAAVGNNPGGRDVSGGWTDGNGNLWLFGGDGYDSTGIYGNLNDLWVYQLSAGSLLAATPTLSLASGTYNTAQTVTISDSIPGATIYYTTDGTTPTAGSSVYNGAITVSVTTTIEAIAVVPGYKTSDTASATYTMIAPFSIAIASGSSTSVSVQPGAAATYSLVVTPQGSATFPAAIILTATGLPAGATATFTPSNLAPGFGTTSVSLSVQTSSATASVDRSQSKLPLAFCLLLLPLFGVRRWRTFAKRLSANKWTALGVLLIVGASLALTGCSGLVVVNPQTGGSTPASYTVTVTAASGTVQQSTTVTVTVQ